MRINKLLDIMGYSSYNRIEEIDKKIEEERNKENNLDAHRIMRLEEEKRIMQNYSSNFPTTMFRYRNPW